MPEEQNDDQQNNQPAPGSEGTNPPAETEGGQQQGESQSPENELPEWARKELTKTRGEAANYRTRLREAEQRLEQALQGEQSAEQVQEALNELKAQNAALEQSLLRATVAGKFNLPDALAKALVGDDEAALEAHAKELSQFVRPKVAPGDLRGGLDPNDADDTFDPVAEARKARSRRY